MKTVKLGDVVKITSGGTPSRKHPEYYDGTIPWIKTGDLKVKLLKRSSELISELGVEKSSAKIFPVNTLLIAMYGASIGNCSLLGIEAATNQACAALLPSQKFEPQFLYYFFKSKKDNPIQKGVGGAQPNISGKILKEIEIPLPDLKTQQQIVAVLERADRLRTACRLAREELDRLAQSVFLEMFGDPMKNPQNYPVSPLQDLIEKIETGKNVKEAADSASAGPFRVIKISAVTWGDFNPSESKSLPFDYQPAPSHFIKKDDFLFTRANTSELIGATAIVKRDFPELVLPDKVWRIIWKKGAGQLYWFQQIMASKPFKHELVKRASGTSGSMKNISQKKLLAIPIITPPISMRYHYSSIMVQVETLRSQLFNKEQELETLFQALLQKAFKGELDIRETSAQLDALAEASHV